MLRILNKAISHILIVAMVFTFIPNYSYAKKAKTSEGLEISSIFLTEVGGEEHNSITGETTIVKAKTVRIELDYEGEQGNLYNICKKITRINIDDKNYKLKDKNDGKKSYVLNDGNIDIYDKYATGKEMVDFFSKRDKHKVEIEFEKGDIINYKDDEYVKPTEGLGDDDNSGDDDDNQGDTNNQTNQNMSEKYEIISIEEKYGDVRFKINNKKINKEKFIEEDIKYIKSVTINGQKFTEWDLVSLSWNGALNFRGEKLIKALREKTPVSASIEFTEGSILKIGNDSQGGNDDNQSNKKIGEKYQIKSLKVVYDEVKDEKYANVEFDPNITEEDLSKIKKIELGKFVKEFNELNCLYKDGILKINDAFFIKEELAKEFEINKKVDVKVTFDDSSLSEKKIDCELTFQKKEDISGDSKKIGEKYKIVKVEIEEKINYNNPSEKIKNVVLSFDKTPKPKEIEKLSIVKFNGETIEDAYKKTLFFINRDGKLSTEYCKDEELRKKLLSIVEKNENLDIELNFKDDSKISYKGKISNENSQNNEAEVGKSGFAKGRKITRLQIITDNMSKQVLEIDIESKDEKKLNSFDIHKFKKITLGQDTIILKSSDITIRSNGKKVHISNNDVIEAAKKSSDLMKEKMQIDFADGSKLRRNIVDEVIKISSNLKKGIYTLSFKTYETGSNKTKESQLSRYFDKKIKLEITENNKKISLLSYVYADMIVDFVIKDKSGKFKKLEKKVIEYDKGNIAKKVEYTTNLDELIGEKEVAVLVSAMGGGSNDLGKYEKYKKASIVFGDIVYEGWTKYKVIEDLENEISTNNERLIKELIRNDVDTNNDGKITKEELMNAEGIETLVAGEKKQHVINLESLKLRDISILKDLGPKIKILNLNGNKLKNLNANTFENAKGLEFLYLGANDIENLPKTIFENQKKLKYIDFDGNSLGNIPEGLFDENKEIKVISLMNAGVTSVPANLIKNNKKLEQIYLQENSIKHLDDNFFENQSKFRLKRVELFSNKLDSLPTSLGEMKGLKKINASHNKIKEIPYGFKNIKQIEDVDFSDNQIKNIPVEFLENMIKYAKVSSSSIRLDLSINKIDDINIDKLSKAMKNGEKLSKFGISRNNLPGELTESEKSKYESVGIKFKDTSYPYFPQNTNNTVDIEAFDDSIIVKHKFDILEMYYWAIGDDEKSGGTRYFNSEKEFEKYLVGNGRIYHNIEKLLKRDEAIVKILKMKNLNWKVKNTIVDENGNILYEEEKQERVKEGLEEKINCSSLDKEGNYIFRKELYIKNNVFGWLKTLEQEKKFVVKNGNQISEKKNVNVKMYKEDGVTLSIADGNMEHVATYVKKNGKYVYTINFSKELSGVALIKDGKEEKLDLKDVGGKYSKQATFESDVKLKEQKVKFIVAAMAMIQPTAIIKFDYPDGYEEDEEKSANVYVLKEDRKTLSMVDKIVSRSILFKKKKGKNTFKGILEFKEMNIKNKKAYLEELSVYKNEKWQKLNLSSGQEGKFELILSEEEMKKIDDSKDTYIKVKMKVKPLMPGHENGMEAVILIDWNKNYKNSGNTSNENPNIQKPEEKNLDIENNGKYKVKVSLWHESKKETSMGDGAFKNNRYAIVTTRNGEYRVEAATNPIEIGKQTLGIGSITSDDDSIKSSIRIEKSKLDNGDKYISKFTFTSNELPEFFDVEITVPGSPMKGSIPARLKFDWKNARRTKEDLKVDTSSSKASMPVKEEEKTEKIDAIKLKSSFKNGIIEAELKSKEAEKIVDKIMEEKSKNKTLLLKIEENKKAKGVKIRIPKDIVRKISSKSTGKIKIESGMIEMSLSRNALKNISDKKGETLSLEAVLSKNNILDVNVEVGNTKVSNLQDGINICVNNDKGIEGKVAVLVNENGTAEIIKKSYQENNKMILNVNGSGKIKFIVNSKFYDDVKKGVWYEKEVDFVTSRNLFNGSTINEFSPNAKMSRAMLVTVLYRLENPKDSKVRSYVDVPQNEYYSKAVNWASENEIVKGNNQKFNPNKEITREEIATILYRYMQEEKNNKIVELKYSDSKDISKWSVEAMKWAVDNNIIKGNNNMLQPKKSASRAEVATLIHRIIKMKVAV